MAARYELEAQITAAKGLKNVNWRHGELKPYAVVWVEDETKCSTYAAAAAATAGETSHRWKQKLLIPFAAAVEESTLHVDIIHAEAAEDTTPLVGSAQIALGDLFSDGAGRAERTLQLSRPSGRPQGTVEIAVSVRELADDDVEDMEVDFLG